VNVIYIPDQIVENSIAVSGQTVFVVAGPSGTADYANATGYMYAPEQGIANSNLVKVL
jgi:hypothetical protein